MNPVLNFFKSFFISLAATIMCLLAVQIMIPLFKKEMINISSSITFYGLKAFSSWIIIFFTIFVVLAAISFTIKAIWELILFFYFTIFYVDKYDSVNLSVDQNNVIRESYVEFKNGQKVPIQISKIVYNNPQENSETTDEEGK